MTSWRLYTRTDEAWAAMLEDIELAERSIVLEQYIFLNDELGNKFFNALKRKARQGLSVRVLIDALGSFSVYVSDLAEELKKEGIQIFFFNPLSPTLRLPYHLMGWALRDHRKLLP